MDKIDLSISKCNLCGNLPKQNGETFKKGIGKILVVGESPSKNGWLVSKRAFYTTENKLQQTGVVLNKLLNLCKLTIEDIDFTECCKCLIEDRKKLTECSNNCKQYLIEQISNSECKIILPMGKVPTEIVLQKKVDKLSNYVGKIFEISFNEQTKLVIPIYHASPINPKSYIGNKEIFEELNKLVN